MNCIIISVLYLRKTELNSDIISVLLMIEQIHDSEVNADKVMQRRITQS